MNLIDTGVWIDWINGRYSPATDRLDASLEREEAVLLPVILQEILQGARSEQAFRALEAQFAKVPRLPVPPRCFNQTAWLYARCRWRGLTIRSPHDCLIAASAVEHGVPLLTLDRDFLAIAQVEPRLVLLGLD